MKLLLPRSTGRSRFSRRVKYLVPGAGKAEQHGLFVPARRKILELALKHRVPSIFNNYLWAETGGLLSYGANFSQSFRRAAEMVGMILNGAKPAAIPVEQPTTFELVINMKTAKALGITIPPTILARADRVIE